MDFEEGSDLCTNPFEPNHRISSLTAALSLSSSSSSSSSSAPLSSNISPLHPNPSSLLSTSSAKPTKTASEDDKKFIDVQNIENPIVNVVEDFAEVDQLKRKLTELKQIVFGNPNSIHHHNFGKKQFSKEMETIASKLIGSEYYSQWKTTGVLSTNRIIYSREVHIGRRVDLDIFCVSRSIKVALRVWLHNEMKNDIDTVVAYLRRSKYTLPANSLQNGAYYITRVEIATARAEEIAELFKVSNEDDSKVESSCYGGGCAAPLDSAMIATTAFNSSYSHDHFQSLPSLDNVTRMNTAIERSTVEEESPTISCMHTNTDLFPAGEYSPQLRNSLGMIVDFDHLSPYTTLWALAGADTSSSSTSMSHSGGDDGGDGGGNNSNSLVGENGDCPNPGHLKGPESLEEENMRNSITGTSSQQNNHRGGKAKKRRVNGRGPGIVDECNGTAAAAAAAAREDSGQNIIELDGTTMFHHFDTTAAPPGLTHLTAVPEACRVGILFEEHIGDFTQQFIRKPRIFDASVGIHHHAGESNSEMNMNFGGRNSLASHPVESFQLPRSAPQGYGSSSSSIGSWNWSSLDVRSLTHDDNTSSIDNKPFLFDMDPSLHPKIGIETSKSISKSVSISPKNYYHIALRYVTYACFWAVLAVAVLTCRSTVSSGNYHPMKIYFTFIDISTQLAVMVGIVVGILGILALLYLATIFVSLVLPLAIILFFLWHLAGAWLGR